MIEFSKWAEMHNWGDVKNQVATRRSELGNSGAEGFQDLADALQIVAKNNPGVARGLVAGLAGKLAMMVRDVDPKLAGRLRSGAVNFLGASSRVANSQDQQDNNQKANIGNGQDNKQNTNIKNGVNS